MTPSLENISILYVVLGLSGLGNIVSVILVAIQTFKRTPPAEAQFADAEQNRVSHDILHRRIDAVVKEGVTQAQCQKDMRGVLSEQQLGEFLVTRKEYLREIQERDTWRHDVNKNLNSINKSLAALAAKSGAEVEL